MKRISVILITGLIAVLPVYAQDSDHQVITSSEDMIKQLSGSNDTQPSENPINRSGSWESVFKPNTGIPSPNDADSATTSASEAESVKTRKIKIYRMEGGKEIWETIVSPEKRTGYFLNLNVQFAVNSHSIQNESFALLNELGKALSDPKLSHETVYINGHTDSDGSEDYNLKLSFRRALAVKDYLISNFPISPDRILVRGYGEGMPLFPNTTKDNKRLNRRVEIVMASGGF
jgi:outer membrane protein OmpA-like peptidoglycan-associated protein